MARLIRASLGWLLFLLLIGAAFWLARDYVRRHPQDVPWTELRLDDPIGRFSGRKLAALTGTPAQCRALLAEAGTGDIAAPPREEGPNCGYSDGMRIAPDGSRTIDFQPQPLVTSCPVAAATYLLDRQVIAPAALEILGSPVVGIEHLGSYSCRRINGRPDRAFSEHSTADALDIAGFTLADGRTISVLEDWDGTGREAAFLRRVRDGACDLFATTLSPDYNQAHADHLHLDQARRGQSGFRLCR